MIIGYSLHFLTEKNYEQILNMEEENICQKFRLKNLEGIKKYFIKEIDQSELMKKKHKKVCTTLS